MSDWRSVKLSSKQEKKQKTINFEFQVDDDELDIEQQPSSIDKKEDENSNNETAELQNEEVNKNVSITVFDRK